ncbi:MAG: fumarylacetoacetate hydrolase family protein [Actinomycetes bacterium]
MTTRIIRFVDSNGDIGVGISRAEGEVSAALSAHSLAELLTLPLSLIREQVDADLFNQVSIEVDRILTPVDGLTEVWASGVTYNRSRSAREEESDHADVYSRVYNAQRPELFFKSVAWRVTGDGEPIGVRSDSKINAPEPELALVCNAHGEIVGLTICNDVSSRSIEGENPLYLGQAKIYSGSCSVGPAIIPIWEISNIYALDVVVSVERNGEIVWQGQTSTSEMHRRFEELVEFLFRQMNFPSGVLLSTGTGIVPNIEFNLSVGDSVMVEISEVGKLINPVISADDFEWLTPDPKRLAR